MNGYVDINPSHLIKIRRKPTKGFHRFAEIVSFGLLSEQEEQETFTAISILQEINVALRSLNITDVVRFTKDDKVVYDDQEGGNTDDMGIVLREVSREEGVGTPVFESLSLLLEHHLPDITLIIDVRIRRRHMIGGYPIQIAVNGLSTEFQRYNSSSDAFAYCWLWSSLMHSHGTHVHDATLVDERGEHLMTVGPDGVNAGESTALDPNVPFAESDASAYSEVNAEVSESSTKLGGFFGDDSSSDSGWLGSVGLNEGGDTGDYGGGDSGSSCSSCGGGD